MRILFTIVILLQTSWLLAQTCSWELLQSYGSTGEQQANTIFSRNGYIYTSGSFSEAFSINGISLGVSGGKDVFIVKSDTLGQVHWAKRLGGIQDEMVGGIACDDNNNVYVAGTFTGATFIGNNYLTASGGTDLFLAKYDATGALLWAKKYGGTGFEYCNAFKLTAQNNFLLGGYFNGNLNFGTHILDSQSNTDDIFIAKMDLNGNINWVHKAGGSDEDRALDLSFDSNENVFICGYFYATASFDGISLSSFGNDDVFVAKYDSTGQVLWAKRAGLSNSETAYTIGVKSNGHCVIGGTFGGTTRFESTNISATGFAESFWAEYNNNGALIWVKHSNGSTNTLSACRSLGIDEQDNLYISGVFQGSTSFNTISLTSNGNYDLYYLKVDINGNTIFAKSGGSTVADGPAYLFVDNSYVLSCGNFLQTAIFDNNSLVSNGNTDFYIGQLCNYQQKIFPGDADNDGIVNIKDYYIISAGYGKTGNVRSEIGLLWKGYDVSPSWATQTITNNVVINDAFLDSNGDGSINLLDVAATIIHRNKIH